MEFKPYLRIPLARDEAYDTNEVSIYNEDDLSHLLYIDGAKAYKEAGHDGHLMMHHPNHDLFHSMLHYRHSASGEHTPLSEVDESALLSHCPSEIDPDEDIALPPSPSRPRGGTVSVSSDDEDFEFPVFLGRQKQPAARRPEQPKSACDMAPAALQTKTRYGKMETRPAKKVKIVMPDTHVEHISGPMMSWWPAEVDAMEYEWPETWVDKHNAVSTEQHVSQIEGQLMSWWPAPLNVQQYDWNERFYE